MGMMQTAGPGPGGLLSSITAGDLIPIMCEFRARTLDLIADLDDKQLIGPRLAIVNPPRFLTEPARNAVHNCTALPACVQ